MSFVGIRNKNKKKKKAGNVEIVRTLLDVHMPTVDENTRLSLLHPSSSSHGFSDNRLSSTTQLLGLNLRRFSHSETALDLLPLAKGATESKVNRSQGRMESISISSGSSTTLSQSDSRTATKESMLSQSNTSMSRNPPTSVSLISTTPDVIETASTANSPVSGSSPLSLELPKLGPPFGIESTIFEDLKTTPKTKPLGSGSMSSSNDALDQTSSCYTPSSSRSSMSSVSNGARSTWVAATNQIKSRYSSVNPVAAGVFDETEEESKPEAKKKRRLSAASSIKGLKLMHPGTEVHFGVDIPVQDEPVHELIREPIYKQPASSQPARLAPIKKESSKKDTSKKDASKKDSSKKDAVKECHKKHKSSRKELPKKAVAKQSAKDKPLPPEPSMDAVLLLHRSSSNRRNDGPEGIVSGRERGWTLSQAANDLEDELAKISDGRSSEESPVLPIQASKVAEEVAPLNGAIKSRAQEFKRSETPECNSRESLDRVEIQPDPLFPKHTRVDSNTSTESEPCHISVGKKAAKTSAPSETKAAKRKFRFSLPVTGLGRKMTSLSSNKRSMAKDVDREAVAKSMERYIDTEISRALNANGNDEEEDDDADWSALYPLKAVKQLGIPMMSSSHIPRLTSAEAERSLRVQLPRLQTARAHQDRPSSALYETPDDIRPNPRETLFIDSPIEEIDETPSDGNKIVIGISKLDYLFPDTTTQDHRRMQLLEARSRPRLSELNLMTEVYELDAGGSSPAVSKSPIPSRRANLQMPSNIPDNVILALMRNVDTLDELFNYAMVNKQCFRVFKKDELSLMKHAMFKMSPPAWELREMTPPWGVDWQGLKDPDHPVPEYTPTLYLRHHARDIFTLVKLKSWILARCGSFLRHETVRGLAGVDEARAAEIDEAFWRIWTFCRIFGSGKNRETDINGQTDWLNGGYLANQQKKGATVLLAEPFFSMNNVLFDPPAGFGRGNGQGLTPSQLYDMTEIWNCLGVLLQVVHAKCTEARAVGIFDNVDIPKGDIAKEEAMLEEWTYFVLTLGPSALVTLGTVCPTDSAEATFRKAKQMGLTKWDAPEYGASRCSFLREAISKTYESRFSATNTPPAQPAARGPFPAYGGFSSNGTSRPAGQTAVRNAPQNQSPPRPEQTFLDMNESRVSPELIRKGPGSPGTTPAPVAPFSPPTSLISPLTSVPSVPLPSRPHVAPTPAPTSAPAAPLPPQVIDPVDKAIRLMVGELGFSEHDAKWALKITDTGDSIDTDAAVRLLMQERRKREKGHLFSRLKRNSSPSSNSSGESLVDLRNAPPTSNGGAGWRWA